MALDKAIASGKEHRAPYRGSAGFDRTCRNHGSCPYCAEGRQRKNRRRREAADEQIDEFAKEE
jgi:hypothetical protein